MLTSGVTPKFFLTRFVCQGFPLSPLLFIIVTHPMLVMLSNLATNGDIVGLHIPSGAKLVAQHWLMILLCFYKCQNLERR